MKGLGRGKVQEIAGMLKVESFAAGALIVRQQEPPDKVYLLARGRVQVRRKLPESEEDPIAELAAGDFFGEMAAVTGSELHTASVVAVTAVTAFSIANPNFIRLLDECPEVSRNVITSMIVQLRGLNNRWLETLRAEKQELEVKVRERTRQLEEVGQRVRRELVLAQNIQRNLLPEKRAHLSGHRHRHRLHPLRGAGRGHHGRLPDRRDAPRRVRGRRLRPRRVCRHGHELREEAHRNLGEADPPQSAVRGKAARRRAHGHQPELHRGDQPGDPEIYLTLFLGVLDMRHLTFEHASAGIHVPPIVLSQGKAKLLFDQSDFPIGHVPGPRVRHAQGYLRPGGRVLFVSDGVIEAQRGGETFGMERLKAEALRVIRGSGGMDVDALVGSVRAFLGGDPPQDDMCLLTLSFTEPGEPTR